jgi:hypothetical protein
VGLRMLQIRTPEKCCNQERPKDLNLPVEACAPSILASFER